MFNVQNYFSTLMLSLLANYSSCLNLNEHFLIDMKECKLLLQSMHRSFLKDSCGMNLSRQFGFADEHDQSEILAGGIEALVEMAYSIS